MKYLYPPQDGNQKTTSGSKYYNYSLARILLLIEYSDQSIWNEKLDASEILEKALGKPIRKKRVRLRIISQSAKDFGVKVSHKELKSLLQVKNVYQIRITNNWPIILMALINVIRDLDISSKHLSGFIDYVVSQGKVNLEYHEFATEVHCQRFDLCANADYSNRPEQEKLFENIAANLYQMEEEIGIGRPINSVITEYKKMPKFRQNNLV